jgi:hypothetical protein
MVNIEIKNRSGSELLKSTAAETVIARDPGVGFQVFGETATIMICPTVRPITGLSINTEGSPSQRLTLTQAVDGLPLLVLAFNGVPGDLVELSEFPTTSDMRARVTWSNR